MAELARTGDVTSLSTAAGNTAGGGNGGNGRLTEHRLSDLERRTGALEGEVRELGKTAERIEAKLDEVASKSYVAWLFGGTMVLVVVSFVVHIAIRSIGQ